MKRKFGTAFAGGQIVNGGLGIVGFGIWHCRDGEAAWDVLHWLVISRQPIAGFWPSRGRPSGRTSTRKKVFVPHFSLILNQANHCYFSRPFCADSEPGFSSFDSLPRKTNPPALPFAAPSVASHHFGSAVTSHRFWTRSRSAGSPRSLPHQEFLICPI